MSATRIGRLLLALGVLVGAAASVGLLLGVEPARLPPALLKLAVYKLTFLAALSMLAAGATVLRHARPRRAVGGCGGSVASMRPTETVRREP